MMNRFGSLADCTIMSSSLSLPIRTVLRPPAFSEIPRKPLRGDAHIGVHQKDASPHLGKRSCQIGANRSFALFWKSTGDQHSFRRRINRRQQD